MTQSRSPRRRFRHREPYRNLDAGAAGRQQHLRDNDKENSVTQCESYTLKMATVKNGNGSSQHTTWSHQQEVK